MSQLPQAATAVDGFLDLVGIVLGLTGVGSGLGITIAVLERRDLPAIEQLGFRGTAVGFLLGVLTVIGVYMTEA